MPVECRWADSGLSFTKLQARRIDLYSQNFVDYSAMEGVAQLAEHRVVAPEAVGSSPTALPT